MTYVDQDGVTVGEYTYDANGNMITRRLLVGIGQYDNYSLDYDRERQLSQVSKNGTAVARFWYDGGGQRVKSVITGTTTITTAYVGNWYEWTTGGATSYYYHAGQRVAMRNGSGLSWVLTDQLGSTTHTSGAQATGECYYPYGARRGSGSAATPYRFTGQFEESTIGLYFYNARWYDPALGRFVSADSIVPQPGDPQSLNRYSYVLNNPLRYTDPTGRMYDTGVRDGVNWAFLYELTGAPLYGVLAQIAEGDRSAKEALEAVLNSTAGPVNGAHFGGIAAERGDRGFAREFGDDYLYGELWGRPTPASQQTGHLLTAVHFGYNLPPIAAGPFHLSRANRIRLVVGHELFPDAPTEDPRDQTYHTARQGLRPGPSDLSNFEKALKLDAAGEYAERDACLSAIFNPTKHGPQETRLGNSMEDLRLTVRGWRLGEMVASGGLTTNAELASWIRRNAVGH